MEDVGTQPWRWRVTYHSLLSRRAPTRLDHGFLYLRPQALRLVLLDANGVTVDARFLKKDEAISQGSEIELPCHSVKQCRYHISTLVSAKHEDVAIATINPAFPDEHIRGAVKDFGALISWDKEASTFGALIAKVRVVDLHCIPHSCVVSSGNEWSAESWSVPIFILSQKLLGGLPVDEELPPADGSTPHPMPNAPFQGQQAAGPMDFQMNNAANGWPF
ncbi:hypothetical protein ACQ4PT_063907 [Festuca glaucescens]